MKSACLFLDTLTKLAVSHAIAQFVKLETFELALQKTFQLTRQIPEELAKYGKIRLSRSEIRRKMGQLFIERNSINLHLDVLDTPELFWDYPELEPLYKMMANYHGHRAQPSTFQPPRVDHYRPHRLRSIAHPTQRCIWHPVKKLTLLLLHLYRICLGPFIGTTCRFYPSCSNYGSEAIDKHGLLRPGSWLLLKRLSKCHPLAPGRLRRSPLIAFQSLKTPFKL